MAILFYLKAVGKHWWALMSCAVFTLLGLYVAQANRPNDWTVRAIFGAAGALLFVACFLAWKDEHHKRLELEKSALENSLPNSYGATRVDVHVSPNFAPVDGPPRLGMRVVHLSDPLLPGSIDVDFRLCLLSGRPPSSLSISPVYSKRGFRSLRFQPLSFLNGDTSVAFEVWELDSPPSRKSRMLRRGWGDLLAEFVGESLGNGWGIETSPVIVKFRDRDDYREQRFRLTYDVNTRQLGVVDEVTDFSNYYENLDKI